jgi:hypothetical protein
MEITASVPVLPNQKKQCCKIARFIDSPCILLFQLFHGENLKPALMSLAAASVRLNAFNDVRAAQPMFVKFCPCKQVETPFKFGPFVRRL